ncbi:Sodium/hydrogen exchanger family-domain-containing protein [Xylaria sp. FL0043]|nr:Sodium/hydrogen exchanger family-domain-containing protein [Xylaria sp. FL0043]
MATQGYLPYYEPALVELLVSSTFLLALNIVNSVLDRALACGLVGQVPMGTAWGQPGARWLSLDFQRAVSSLGYLGLILIVLLFSVVVPISLSFALRAPTGSFLGTTSAALLPAFAAGGALCSTEPGHHVLRAAGEWTDLDSPERIISGGNEKEKEKEDESARKGARVRSWIYSQEAAFVFQIAFLILLIVEADYAGTSILLAAYLAGVVVSWCNGQWDDTRGRSQAPCVESDSRKIPISTERQSQAQPLHGQRASNASSSSETTKQETVAVRHTGLEVFNTYYAQVVSRVLKPFFFASIGFSIPISQLFVGKIVWRGISYSILMVLGKLVCGLWLVRFPISRRGRQKSLSPPITFQLEQMLSRIRSWSLSPVNGPQQPTASQPSESPSTQTAPMEPSHSHGPGSNHSAPSPSLNCEVATPPKPLSLYPVAVMGCATSELFLIVTWAIFLCTILSPLYARLLVRHIKRLEKASESSRGGASSVLGAWDVGSIG